MKNTLANRLKFLESYFKLCDKYGMYLDSCRSASDMRVWVIVDHADEGYYDLTKAALYADAGCSID